MSETRKTRIGRHEAKLAGKQTRWWGGVPNPADAGAMLAYIALMLDEHETVMAAMSARTDTLERRLVGLGGPRLTEGEVAMLDRIHTLATEMSERERGSFLWADIDTIRDKAEQLQKSLGVWEEVEVDG